MINDKVGGKVLIKLGVILVVWLLLIGCSNSDNGFNQEMDHSAMNMESEVVELTADPMSGSVGAPDALEEGVITEPVDGRIFTLHATLQEEDDKVVVNIDTDLTFSSDNYNGSHVFGEGHIHFYL